MIAERRAVPCLASQERGEKSGVLWRLRRADLGALAA